MTLLYLVSAMLLFAFSVDANEAEDRFSPARASWNFEEYSSANHHRAETLLEEIRAGHLPETTSFRASFLVRPKKSLMRLDHQTAVAKLPVYAGREHPPIIHLEAGQTTIAKLAIRLSDPSVLECLGVGGCTLRAPLLIGNHAGLIIDGIKLGLSAEHGAMIINHGALLIEDAEIEGQRNGGAATFERKEDFRPFLVGFGGSHTRIIDSRLANLGYAASKSYGLTISTSRADGRGETPPSAVIAGSVIDGLYYGFFSHRAHWVDIVGNWFKNNIVYGIDPHDYTDHLRIIGNIASGTKKRHGIVISRGVGRTLIVDNHSYKNSGTGIMVDRHSNRNIVLDNIADQNGSDGIAIYESHNITVAGNRVLRNAKVGIRVRNSRNVTLTENSVEGNNGGGIKLYASIPGGQPRKAEDIYSLEFAINLLNNQIRANRPYNWSINCPTKPSRRESDKQFSAMMISKLRDPDPIHINHHSVCAKVRANN